MNRPINKVEPANLLLENRAIFGVYPVELSVIVPTFRERENVSKLVSRLEKCLAGIFWEVIFVDDDSPDGTAELVRSLGQSDSRIRCIQRIGRRGLSSAVVEGMLTSSAPNIAVMDGDLQHDENILLEMLNVLKKGEKEIVIGSRYVKGGEIGNWGKSRASISKFATWLSRIIVPRELTDPMSGFFMIKRQVLDMTVRNLSAMGFKILVDIFASSPRALDFQELPYKFQNRVAGESKLDNQAAYSFLMLLIDKSWGGILPARFIGFMLVGGIGILIHFIVLSLLFYFTHCNTDYASHH